ncbi:MAG: efflux RND transporter periplasmic adaptor subunit, partial [Gammaproteobacteria bacterium]
MNKRLLFAAGVCAALAAGWLVFQRPGEAPAAAKHKARTLTVETTVAAVRPMPIRLTAVGRVESPHVVQVRPQVSGMLKKVAFTEGDEVHAGQLLFEIDPAPFEAALAQARAALQRDRAALAKARWQEQRLAPLAKLDYVTPQEYEDAKAASKEAAAAVAADRAAVTQARIQLRYTRIEAPIAGRSGAVAFREGNLVQANSATPLVTIKEIAPIRVRFSVPQGQLPDIRRYRAAGTMRVTLRPAGRESRTPETGRVVFVDNTV